MAGTMEDQSMMTSGLLRPHQAQLIPYDHLQMIVGLLKGAISTGDVEKAKQIAERLARENVRLSIELTEEEKEKRINEESISVKVHVEDRETSGCQVNIKVKPSDTIGDLKRRMFAEYGFPTEVQKWIIGQRIPKDTESLRQCRIKTSGHTLYLYLMTAKSVGLGSEQAEAVTTQGGRGAGGAEMSGDYMTMNAPMNPSLRGQNTGSLAKTHQTPKRQSSSVSTSSTVSSGLSPLVEANDHSQVNLVTPELRPITVDPRPRQAQGGGLIGAAFRGQEPGSADVEYQDRLVYTSEAINSSSGNLQSGNPQPPPVMPMSPANDRPGWECPACTFINLPYRPGCEVCSTTRPPEYQAPIGYIMSKEELCWLADQEEQERMVSQTNAQRGGEAYADDAPLTEEQLDLILRFNDALVDLQQRQNAKNTEGGGSQPVTDASPVCSAAVDPVSLGEDVPDTDQCVPSDEDNSSIA